MSGSFRTSMTAMLALLTVAGAASAAEMATLPPESAQGAVKYITGGIGYDEAEAMRQAVGRYPLAIELAARAAPRDVYLADVQVAIRDRSGKTVLATTTQGPFLLASLPPGRYTIDAETGGASQQKSVTVSSGLHQRVLFEFPAD